jgi:hypothetical protein
MSGGLLRAVLRPARGNISDYIVFVIESTVFVIFYLETFM